MQCKTNLQSESRMKSHLWRFLNDSESIQKNMFKNEASTPTLPTHFLG